MSSTGRLVIDTHDTHGELLTSPSESTDRVTVQLSTGPHVQIDRHLLTPREGGGFRYEGTFSDAESGEDVIEERRIPIAHEEASVRRETHETGRVRLIKSVSEQVETIEEPVREHYVTVERIPVGHMIDEAPSIREEGDVLVIPVVEERLVITKQLVLKEEVRVTRREQQHTASETVTLRSEEVDVEREENAQGS